jgi:hypothetical protein
MLQISLTSIHEYTVFIIATLPPPQVSIILDVSASHNDTPQSVRLLWTGDRTVAETSDNTQHSLETYMPPAGLEPAFPAIGMPLHVLWVDELTNKDLQRGGMTYKLAHCIWTLK